MITLDPSSYNRSLGKPAAFDFCMTSQLNSLILSEAGVSSGAAAHASEIRKHNSNDAECGELGWVCIPWLLRHTVHGVKRLSKVLLSWHLGWQSPAPSQSRSL